MSTTYQVAVGHDNAAGLVTVSPQPRSPLGIQYPRHIVAGDGTVYVDGAAFAEWEFENLTTAQYTALLAAMGLTTAASNVTAAVTVHLIGLDRSTYANYNAAVVHRKTEDTNYERGLYRRALFVFKQLEAI